jgi:four helix bundle protein
MESLLRTPAKSFRDMRVWQAAYELSLEIYKLCGTFPSYERYGLSDQMCRAAVSVCSNIAEGFGRRSAKEKDQFYAIANSSLTELENQLLISQGVGYAQNADYPAILQQCEKTHRLLSALQKANHQAAIPKSKIKIL